MEPRRQARARAIRLVGLLFATVLAMAALTACEGAFAICQNKRHCEVSVSTDKQKNVQVTKDVKLEVASITDDSAEVGVDGRRVTLKEGGQTTIGEIRITLMSAEQRDHLARLAIDR